MNHKWKFVKYAVRIAVLYIHGVRFHKQSMENVYYALSCRWESLQKHSMHSDLLKE